MIKVGITGGIGSGKTHICKLLEEFYIPVFYTDDVSKEILATNSDVKKYILDSYGESSYIDAKPNSKFLANILFNDDVEMKKLVKKVYPLLIIELNKWFEKQSGKNIVLVESAIMFNSDFSTDNLDYVVAVTADIKTRIDRVLKRDSHRTYSDVLTIITKQLPNDKVVKLSDFIIENNGDGDLGSKINELRDELFYLSSIK